MRKHDFCNLLIIPSKKPSYTFKRKYSKIIDDVANGTSAGSGITDIFMCNFERKYHKDFSNDFKLSLIVQKDLRNVCGLNILNFFWKGCSLV